MKQLSPQEMQVYQALCQAIDNGEPCPTNLDIEMITGYSSGSMGPAIIRRLEQKGFIQVRRYQRFRQIQICATGKWTVRSPSQHTTRKHVPRGAGSQAGKLAKKARNM